MPENKLVVGIYTCVCVCVCGGGGGVYTWGLIHRGRGGLIHEGVYMEVT